VRVAILSSEAVPFVKTGGLGDVSGALPKALNGHGVDAFLVLPLHEQIDRKHLKNVALEYVSVEWQGRQLPVRVWYSDAAGAPAFLIEEHGYFTRPAVYGYRDDHERYAFFCRAALEMMHQLGPAPDVVHLNDWPGGFGAVELFARRFWDGYFRNTRTLFSIHNLAYQGVFDTADLPKLGFGASDQVNAFLFNGSASALKAGLWSSDVLSTVSPTYAREIQTPEHGNGLDWLLRMRSGRLIGITNGVDYDIWNPRTDPNIPAHFTIDDLSGKLECKRELLRQFALPENLERPIIANISRLTSQKGYDLILQAAGAMVETGAYFIALGAGADEYENFLQSLRNHAPYQVGIYKGMNESLAHLIEAGADLFLMPSRFEPCGLNQMYSMRYGTVPVVRATGGLEDTVEDFNRVRRTGTGFKFRDYSAHSMLEKIYEALYCYVEPDVWDSLQKNGMSVDNSWQAAARKYINVYEATTRL
jgi:starch synthase